jgi:hypothetical protein
MPFFRDILTKSLLFATIKITAFSEVFYGAQAYHTRPFGVPGGFSPLAEGGDL